MTEHGRDATLREEMIERVIRIVTATMCAARLPDCPMHRSMATRYINPTLIAIASEGWEIVPRSWDPPKGADVVTLDEEAPAGAKWFALHWHNSNSGHVHSTEYASSDNHDGIPEYDSLSDAREAPPFVDGKPE